MMKLTRPDLHDFGCIAFFTIHIVMKAIRKLELVGTRQML